MVTMPSDHARFALPPAALRLRLDREALAHNWRTLDGWSGTATAGAAVKADAYGMGATTVVPELARTGCRNWFVAHWSEAAALLPHVPAEQVAVLHGPLNDADVAFARASGVRPVLNSLEQAHRWSAAGGGACHVMVDTGINRLGLAMDDLGDPSAAKCARSRSTSSKVNHFAPASVSDRPCGSAGFCFSTRRKWAWATGIR